MLGLFRLRYYLHRPGEKHPLLLLEPILLFSRAFLPRPNIITSYFFYTEGNACQAVELRKLQAVNKPQQLLRELQAQNGKPMPELAGELQSLWQASIKGIALRQLARPSQDQLLAAEGIWLANERSFYTLLPYNAEPPPFGYNSLGTLERQPIELQENSTSRTIAGTITVMENFAKKKILLCRLSLGHRSFISMKQALPRGDGLGYLYSVRKLEGTAEGQDIFLFAPASIVSGDHALRNFLQSRLPYNLQSGEAKQLAKQDGGARNLQTDSLVEVLEELTAQWFGWGRAGAKAYSVSINNEESPKIEAQPKSNVWLRLGAWRVQRELLQKCADYMLKRAHQFGGYPIDQLLKELHGMLPSPLLFSLLDYLCAPPSAEQPAALQASCQKIDGYLLAKQALYVFSPDNRLKHISPQGRRMLEDLAIAGQAGMTFLRLQREQPQVVQALLRSGQAVQHGSRCYATNFAPDFSSSGKTNSAPRRGQTQQSHSSPKNTPLESILSDYKKKNQLRRNSQEMVGKIPGKRYSKQNIFQGKHKPLRSNSVRNNNYRHKSRNRNITRESENGLSHFSSPNSGFPQITKPAIKRKKNNAPRFESNGLKEWGRGCNELPAGNRSPFSKKLAHRNNKNNCNETGNRSDSCLGKPHNKRHKKDYSSPQKITPKSTSS